MGERGERKVISFVTHLTRRRKKHLSRELLRVISEQKAVDEQVALGELEKIRRKWR